MGLTKCMRRGKREMTSSVRRIAGSFPEDLRARGTLDSRRPYIGMKPRPKARSMNQPRPKRGDGEADGGFQLRGVGALGDEQEQGEGAEDDGELADLDAHVEGEQAAEGGLAGQAEAGEDIGETEAVDETEEKGKHPAVGDVGPQQVFRRRHKRW